MKITEDQYVLQHGGDVIIGTSCSMQSVHCRTMEQAVQMSDDLRRRLQTISAINSRLRAEYRAMVASGEIEAPTQEEQLIEVANGHEDNEATHAARRCCAKRGINWQRL